MDLKIEFSKEYLLRNKIAILGIAIAIIGLFYGFKIYISDASAIDKIHSQISMESDSADIAKRLSARQEELDNYNGYFAHGKDALWLLDKVSKAANDSGLTITSMNSKPVVFLETFIRAEVNMAVSGTFHELGDFAAKLEGSNDFINISQLSLRKDENHLKADIDIETYFLR